MLKQIESVTRKINLPLRLRKVMRAFESHDIDDDNELLST